MSAQSRRARALARTNPIVKLRATAAAVVAVVGAYWLVSGHDAAFAGALLAFAGASALILCFDVLVAVSADQTMTPEVSLSELVNRNQAAVLTLTGTTLGLLAAFSENELPVTTKAAVVSLVGAVLVQLTVQASGARHLGRAAWRVGLIGDLVAEWLLSFGLIALATSLVAQDG